MPNTNDLYSVKELFSSNDCIYRIPIYQRNFSWEEPEITQLIHDVADYSTQENDYYIGTLIVNKVYTKSKKSVIFETIDGQQRLTTLCLLLSYMKNELLKAYKNIEINWYKKVNLEFETRRQSTAILKDLFEKGSTKKKIDNSGLVIGYHIIRNNLIKILNEKKNVTIQQFCKYLFSKVKILRSEVPPKTNLNHYFEIMNTRGEQLEKHEILKSSCLELIKDDSESTHLFNTIWEACSNMDRYIQMAFTNIEERKIVFGKNFNILQHRSFDVIRKNMPRNLPNNDEPLSIIDVIKNPPEIIMEKGNVKVESQRFNSLINFPNFLLQVLRVQENKNIPLDDKHLLEQFKPYIKNKETGMEFVKKFSFNLLKCKYLMDTYILKREYDSQGNRWSLKKAVFYSKGSQKGINYLNTFGDADAQGYSNKEITMLLAMFHVSMPALNYKHWFSAVLKYLFESSGKFMYIDPLEYKDYLRNLAKAFLFDNYLAKEVNKKDYYEIIFKNNAAMMNNENDINMEYLNKGTAVENFIFNYLDYLLWCKNPNDNFEFAFRSSVEHFYPQHPTGTNKPLDDVYLHNFGNLCLVSREQNSQYNNDMPMAKIQNYGATIKTNSMKLQIMAKLAEKDGDWNIKKIEAHGNKMQKILLEELLNL